jgi:hypothetical protein
MRKTLEVAEPDALVEEATSRRYCCDPYAPWSVSFANAVEVPSARLLVVLSKKKRVLSPAKAVPLANWIAPVPPTAVPPEERQDRVDLEQRE